MLNLQADFYNSLQLWTCMLNLVFEKKSGISTCHIQRSEKWPPPPFFLKGGINNKEIFFLKIMLYTFMF